MLVLSRNVGEAIRIGDTIRILIVDVDRGTVKVGVEAPRDVVILREELVPRKPE